MGGNRLAATDGVHTFIGLGFQVDLRCVNAEGLRQYLAHRREMRTELWPFGDHDRVYIVDLPVMHIEKLPDVIEELQTRGAFPRGVCVREVRADIAQACRAQQRVADGMRQNVAIGMADGPFIERDFDAAQD
jgi:hypothetical protein